MGDKDKLQDNDIITSAEETPEILDDQALESVDGGFSLSSTMISGTGFNTAFGGFSADTIYAGGSADTIYAGGSADTIYGGTVDLFGGTIDPLALRKRPGR